MKRKIIDPKAQICVANGFGRCEKPAVYIDKETGKHVCGDHATGRDVKRV